MIITLENIEIHFSGNIFLFVLGFLTAALFTFYIYRYTIPNISKSYKIFLITIRSITLLLLLILIFEPILTYTNKLFITPSNLIFVDNSKSISVNKDKDEINSLINNFDKKSDYKLFTFGSKAEAIDKDSLSKINYKEATTNFNDILKYISNNYSEISSLTIISDGNITDGASPLYETEKYNFPIYTIGIGDTTIVKDVFISKTNFNKYIYANTPTIISVVVNNIMLSGETVYVSFYEDDKLIERKNISLSKDGLNNLSFDYLPKFFGEKKLRIKIDSAEGEDNFLNNVNTFFINVLKSKIRILLIAGSPSNDLSILKTSLNGNKDYLVKSLTYISDNTFLEKGNINNLLDSSDIFFLIGFPSSSTNTDFIAKIKNKINIDNKPLLFILSNNVDYGKLELISDELPFNLNNPNNNIDEVMTSIVKEELTNPILQISDTEILKHWNNLSPVFQSITEFVAKPGTKVLSQIVINNITINKPLIISSNIAGKRSISILASSIWRWKLIGDKSENNLFDKIIFNCVKWLNTNDNVKKVIIKPIKKLFALNEDVEFTAQIYDESLNPISNADVNAIVKDIKTNTTTNIIFTSKGNGLYEGIMQTNVSGDYSFISSALLNGKKLGDDSGKFNIGEVDLELTNTKLNSELLKSISKNTNGMYFTISDKEKYIQLIREKNKNNKTEKIIKSEISLWSDSWFLIIIVLLFSIEWFIRKRLNMM
ncbi:MAG: hypothetical protein CO128_08050 [Ignavibacteriales bacterium CG_4_9_14_3_um_filter_30_11]|nr:MAG: hypothetical protein CO128_08050 [Ignavibacteriales bacterium CG_4_9_14_3_um_filter_30_11]